MFYVVSAGGALINYGVAVILVYLVTMDGNLANLCGILLGFIWNFMVNRRVTWTRK